MGDKTSKATGEVLMARCDCSDKPNSRKFWVYDVAPLTKFKQATSAIDYGNDNPNDAATKAELIKIGETELSEDEKAQCKKLEALCDKGTFKINTCQIGYKKWKKRSIEIQDGARC